ncbi:hypothetical protein VTK73DRAFT_8799 [Phialemonium thermophilum]|uniref:Uncharacterized protein n=1 Tax=Phialemonium thermophilum TaxID=223376 RepID=A0ABR3W690_9PEZI
MNNSDHSSRFAQLAALSQHAQIDGSPAAEFLRDPNFGLQHLFPLLLSRTLAVNTPPLRANVGYQSMGNQKAEIFRGRCLDT